MGNVTVSKNQYIHCTCYNLGAANMINKGGYMNTSHNHDYIKRSREPPLYDIKHTEDAELKMQMKYYQISNLMVEMPTEPKYHRGILLSLIVIAILVVPTSLKMVENIIHKNMILEEPALEKTKPIKEEIKFDQKIQQPSPQQLPRTVVAVMGPKEILGSYLTQKLATIERRAEEINSTWK